MKKHRGKGRQTRQEEATARAVERQERTDKEQLELLKARPGASKKEKTRLLKKS